MEIQVRTGSSHAVVGPQPDGFPWIGLICVVLSALLAARLVWEQITLTIRNGPQMVGFWLLHVLGPVVLAPWAAALWTLIVAGKSFRARSWPSPFRIGLLGMYAVTVVFIAVPYGYWQRLNVSNLAHGPYAGGFMCYAAAAGDLATVKAFVAEGVSVDVRCGGGTPLHGAATENQVAVIEYLLSKGASVNALDAYGDSPLANAATNGQADAITLLKAHGGKRIFGSDAQRDQAIKEQSR